MDPEINLQQEMFGIWLKKLRKRASTIQSFADMLSSQHGLEQMGKMLNGFATDCQKLYELGYEIGLVSSFNAQPAAPETNVKGFTMTLERP